MLVYCSKISFTPKGMTFGPQGPSSPLTPFPRLCHEPLRTIWHRCSVLNICVPFLWVHQLKERGLWAWRRKQQGFYTLNMRAQRGCGRGLGLLPSTRGPSLNSPPPFQGCLWCSFHHDLPRYMLSMSYPACLPKPNIPPGRQTSNPNTSPLETTP